MKREHCFALVLLTGVFIGTLSSSAFASRIGLYSAESRSTTSNGAPTRADYPFPGYGSRLNHINVTLTWISSDPDNDPLTYDVYFGSTVDPPLVANGPVASYTPPALNFGTWYYWRIDVHDDHGHTTRGILFDFATKALPSTPTPSYPPAGAENIPATLTLSWSSTDAAGDPLKYDVYFGEESPPPLVASNHPTNEYLVNGLSLNLTYYWKIVAREPEGGTTAGPVWSFFTGPVNHPPGVPNTPSPPHNTPNMANALTLSWQTTEPDGDAMTFKVFLGTESPPPLYDTVSSPWLTVNELNYGTVYYWSVTARDNGGLETPGPLWTFVTIAHTNTKPFTSSWFPAAGATNVTPGVTLTWHGTDPDGETVTYDVYMGSLSNPQEPMKTASGLTQPNFTPGLLLPGATYWWLVWPRDASGLGVIGDYLTFTTASTATGTHGAPLALSLGRNHPNPFNPQTAIPYTVPSGASMHVRIAIFDATGRRVRTLVDETQSAGAREVIWRGENEAGTVVSSGIYYCVMDAGGKRFTQKLVLLK